MVTPQPISHCPSLWCHHHTHHQGLSYMHVSDFCWLLASSSGRSLPEPINNFLKRRGEGRKRRIKKLCSKGSALVEKCFFILQNLHFAPMELAPWASKEYTHMKKVGLEKNLEEHWELHREKEHHEKLISNVGLRSIWHHHHVQKGPPDAT